MDVKNGTMYVTMYPCNECAKLMIQAGIREVVYCEGKLKNDASSASSSGSSKEKKKKKALGENTNNEAPTPGVTVEKKRKRKSTRRISRARSSSRWQVLRCASTNRK